MQKEQVKNLIWFTTNLRTNDNQVVSQALSDSDSCIALYCLDPGLLTPTALGFPKLGKFRLQFLLESLEDLAKQLFKLGITFKIIVGNPEKEIPKFIQDYHIKVIYHQNDWTTEERTLMAVVKAACPSSIQWIGILDQFLIHPEDAPFEIKDLPFMFTEFRKLIEASLIIRKEHFVTNNPSRTTN